MDRNLGALDDRYHPIAEFKSKYYQFGRKDPFNSDIYCWTYDAETFAPSKTATKNGAVSNSSFSHIDDQYHTNGKNVPFATNNPTTFIIGNEVWTTGDIFSQIDNIWSDPANTIRIENEEIGANANKSIFDPCPSGWKIPNRKGFIGFVGDNSGSATGSPSVNCQWQVEDDANGKHRGSLGRTYFPNGYLNERNNPNPQTTFFPSTGYRANKLDYTSYGSYLYMDEENPRAPSPNIAHAVYLMDVGVYLSSSDGRGYRTKRCGMAVRCIKE